MSLAVILTILFLPLILIIIWAAYELGFNEVDNSIYEETLKYLRDKNKRLSDKIGGKR